MVHPQWKESQCGAAIRNMTIYCHCVITYNWAIKMTVWSLSQIMQRYYKYFEIFEQFSYLVNWGEFLWNKFSFAFTWVTFFFKRLLEEVMGGDGKRGTGRVSSMALHRKRSSILRVIAVVIICNFHFIKDRPLYFLVKGGKRLFGVIFSLQEFLFVTVYRFYQNLVLFGLFVLFFLSVCFWRDSLCRFLFLLFKKYHGLSVTGDDHRQRSRWSYFHECLLYPAALPNSVKSRFKKLTRF